MLYLSDNFTQVTMTQEERRKALDAAYRITLSPHEHEWTHGEQELMARYCLWTGQRLAAVKEIMESELNHRPQGTTCDES